MIRYDDYKVLIVDDELDILKSLNRDLRLEPYEKLFANTGEQALKFFETENDIAVIVTDMRMPGMNGLQLLERLHVLSPDTLKIVLTGYTQLPQILATVNKVDIYKFLTKPWDLENELKVYIREAIELYEKRKEVGNQLKSQEQKSKLFNKMLIESYEKTDFLVHTLEQFSHALNYHHLLTMQELKALEKDENFDIRLQTLLVDTKDRVHYMNQIFDVNNFGVRAFDIGELYKELNAALSKNHVILDPAAFKYVPSETGYRDNIKPILILLVYYVEIFYNGGHRNLLLELGQMTNPMHIKLYLKLSFMHDGILSDALHMKVKFFQQLIKNIGGVVTLNQEGDDYVADMEIPVKPEHSIMG